MRRNELRALRSPGRHCFLGLAKRANGISASSSGSGQLPFLCYASLRSALFAFVCGRRHSSSAAPPACPAELEPAELKSTKPNSTKLKPSQANSARPAAGRRRAIDRLCIARPLGRLHSRVALISLALSPAERPAGPNLAAHSVARAQLFCSSSPLGPNFGQQRPTGRPAKLGWPLNFKLSRSHFADTKDIISTGS